MTDITLLPRRPYRGSCHCGLIRYIVYVRLPSPTASAIHLTESQRHAALAGTSLYKCNCSTCHKTGTFHLRLPDAPSDIAILAPLTADGTALKMEQRSDEGYGLREYRCFSKTQAWYFCGRCGVRTFCIKGKCEPAKAKFSAALLRGMGPDGKAVGEEISEGEEEIEVSILRPVKEGWSEPYKTYLSVNMTSLEPRQDGLDLRKLHENGWLGYCEYLDETGDAAKTPFEGGIY